MQRSGERRIYSQGPWWKAAAASMPSEAVSATRGFVDLLKSLNVSLMLSSRQDSAVLSLSAGASACELSRVAMPAPMGLARRGDRLAVGTSMALRIFQDLTPADPQAAHYLPVASHLIGAVSVHDVDWDDSGQLWFANTQFSALCTTGGDGHFRMQWRPPFVTAPGPVDACHLNGMALDGRGPDAGVLLATDRADVLRERLSLPHSPRLHDGALWLLESGAGRLLRLDPATGRGDVVCELPGVLRGLDFARDYAFIALSRVREGSGEASRVLGERFPRAEVCRVFAVDCRRGATIGHADLPMISEVATLHLHAKPKVVLLEPTPQQVATTLLVDA
jgi:hypothetical protein